MIILFVCLECQHIFDEDEVAIWKEGRGEYWGTPCSEELNGCPKCRGSFVKAHKCDCCEEWIDNFYMKTDDGKRYCLNCYQVMDLGEEE